MTRTMRIGCGAGFQGDRFEPAVVLAAQGGLDWLMLECLAERTIALATLERMRDPEAGYDPLLDLPFRQVRLLDLRRRRPRAMGGDQQPDRVLGLSLRPARPPHRHLA